MSHAEDDSLPSLSTMSELSVEAITEEELSEALQAAFKWAGVGFQTRNTCNDSCRESLMADDVDPFEREAFKKASRGLVSAALRLVGSELAFLSILEEVMPGFPFGSQAHIKEDANPDDNPAVSRFEGEMLDDSEAQEVCETQESNFDNKQAKQNSLPPHHDHSDMREFLCKERLPLFKDIASLEGPKRLLQESIILPSRCPQLFKGVRRPWKAILMHGPPGTGKTELAKAVAGESGACFLLLAPSSLLSKFMGESERTLSQVFSYARSMAPAVIFIDEIDAFGGDRDGQTEPGLRRLMTEMLLQFNSLGEGVVVVAATNRIQDIDPALLRRFERKIEVGLLGEDDRAKLLKLKMKGTPMEPGIDLSLIAKLTNGYSGAEMELVCREAAMYGLRELLDSAGDGPALSASLTVRPIVSQDFIQALENIKPNSTLQQQHGKKAPIRRGGRKRSKSDSLCNSSCSSSPTPKKDRGISANTMPCSQEQTVVKKEAFTKEGE